MTNLTGNSGDTPDRLRSLDGWRAIAILLVLLSHLWATTGAPDFGPLWGAITSQGNLGVRIFFVLSGFLITLLLLREHGRAGSIDLRAFYVRRVFRILPVYLLYLLVVFVLQATRLHHEAASSWIGALTFTRNVIGQGGSATDHFWSLAIEEQFYLVWPSMLAIVGLACHRRIAVTMLLMGICGAITFRVIPCDDSGFVCRYVLHPNSVLMYMDSLAAGALAAFLFIAPTTKVQPAIGSAICLASTTGLVVSALVVLPDGLPTSLQVAAQAVLCASAILGSIVGCNPITALLNVPIMRWLGVMSYSLYVWHVLFLAHYVGPAVSSGNPIYGAGFWWIAALCIAAASYYLYERHFIAWGRRLADRSGPREFKPNVRVD